MKFKLAKKIGSYDNFLVENQVTISAPTASTPGRDSIIRDCDSIITSLETLSKNLVEDLETINDLHIDEKTKDTNIGKMSQFAADFIFYGPKYSKLQKKVTTMAMNAEDLKFAARGEEDKNRKAALNDKAAAVKGQVKELQKSIDDKATERGPWVAKTLSATKIQGQLDILKHMTGLTDDPEDKRSLQERMKDLNGRMQEELAALKELKKKNEGDTDVQAHQAKQENKSGKNSSNESVEVNEEVTYEEVLAEINEEFEVTEEMLAENKFMDWLIYARRYRKLQKKINAMKMNSHDLGFAAANLGRSMENADKKSALNDKKRMLDSQIAELQDALDDKIKERGPYVKKVVDKTRIEGQIELIKHMSGQSDDPAEIRSLKQRMADLKKREAEELEAMKDYERRADAEAIDVKGDDETLRLKAVLDDARETLRQIDKKQNPVAYAEADLEVAQADLNYKVEKGDRDGVATAQEKVAKKQEALKNAMDAEANVNQSPAQTTGATTTDNTGAPTQDNKQAEITAIENEIKDFDNSILSTQNEITKMEAKLKEAETERSRATDPTSFDAKINSLKLDITGYKEDIKNLQGQKAVLVKKLQAVTSNNESVEINEGKWANIMKGVRKSETGPWTIVAIEGKKVIGQDTIEIQDAIPAGYEAMKREHPKAKLHIEDATGQVVWNESIAWNMSDRAIAAGLTELAESIAIKEDWQLDGTKLYTILESEIRKAEATNSLNESRYTTLSIKDRMNKLI